MNEKQNPQMLNETDLSDVSGGNNWAYLPYDHSSSFSIGDKVQFMYYLENHGIQFWNGKIIDKTNTDSGVSFTIELDEQARQLTGTSSVSIAANLITGYA